MSSLFNIGTSALRANQRALETTGQNIANAGTEGYSRQRTEFSARHVSGFAAGQGVDVVRTRRISDGFATERLVESSAEKAALDAEAGLARRLDASLSTEASGLARPLREFIDALDGWVADPGAPETRLEVLGGAEALAMRFSQQQVQMDDFNVEINVRTGNAVQRVNELTDAIARLNDEIAAQTPGQPANALLDQRDQMVSDLAQQIDVRTVVQDDSSVNVFTGNGQALVTGSTVRRLSAVPSGDGSGATRVEIAGGGDLSEQIRGGELGGLFGFRAEVLEPAREQLNALAQGITDAVNTVQGSGLDANGQAGAPLFERVPPGARLNVQIDDPAALAASLPGAGADGNGNAQAMVDALRGPLIGGQSAQEANITMLASVGSQARRLEASATAQAAVVSQQQLLRDSVSGVNLDEEAADLLRYQQAYQAAAQVIVVANTVFDSLLAATR